MPDRHSKPCRPVLDAARDERVPRLARPATVQRRVAVARDARACARARRCPAKPASAITTFEPPAEDEQRLVGASRRAPPRRARPRCAPRRAARRTAEPQRRQRESALSASFHTTGPAVSRCEPSGRPSTCCAAARGLEQRLERDARSRCPSRAASRRGPRWRCCPSRPPAPGSRRARRSSTRTTCTPASSAASTLARPCPRVLWKWAVSSTSSPSASRAAGKNSRTWARVGHAGRVAEADLLRAGVAQPARDREHALGRHVALVGAAEGDRDHALAAQPPAPRAAEHALEPGQRLLDRAVDVVAVVRLGGRQEHVDLVEAVALRRARCRARARSGSAPTARRRRARRCAASTSAPSASCGITSARTKLVTSSRRSPVRASSSISRTLASVGMTSGSFWNPSRGPTSRMRICTPAMLAGHKGARPLDTLRRFDAPGPHDHRRHPGRWASGWRCASRTRACPW